jgi:hypothetical protein
MIMSESRPWAWTYSEIEKDLETRWDKQAAGDYTDDLFNSKQNRLTAQTHPDQQATLDGHRVTLVPGGVYVNPDANGVGGRFMRATLGGHRVIPYPGGWMCIPDAQNAGCKFLSPAQFARAKAAEAAQPTAPTTYPSGEPIILPGATAGTQPGLASQACMRFPNLW